MNAPYDGDRGRAPGDGSGQPEEPYVRDAYPRDPYRPAPEDRDPLSGTGPEQPLPDARTPRPQTWPEAPGSATAQGPAVTPGPPPVTPGAGQGPVSGHDETVQFPGAGGSFPDTTSLGTPQTQDPQALHQPRPQQPADAPAPQHRTLDFGTGPAGPEDDGLPGGPAPKPAQPRRPAGNDAFAHLFRDQGHSPDRQPAAPQHISPPPMPENDRTPAQAEPEPDPAPAPYAPAPEAAPAPEKAEPAEAPASKASGLLKSSAVMAAGTMVSRLTGFIRSAMIVAAVGAAVLGDTYQLAITLPTMLYVLTVGGGLNSVFVPQLVRAMKEDDDGGEAYANRLLTLVTVILGVLAVAAVFAAPLLVRAMSVKIAENPAANEVAVTFVRYCMPSIFFMGVHVVMGQILNARGRFGAMMWTPVLNNIVIIGTIGMFLWVYGTAGTSGLTVTTIPPEGVRLLGVGTLLGLVVQALAMIPYLRATGFRVRPRFDWRGHGLGKAARLAKWTVLFVLANQAGVLVVSQLSTWAGETASADGNPGTGYIAYSNAQLIWNMPQAIITVSVMAALLPRLSRAASDGDNGAVRDDISQGLRNSAVAIVPIAFGFVALGIPMCLMIYGSSGTEAATSMGYALMAFGVGLIPFSVQYVVLRAFYAYEDTRTPFFNTVIVAAVNAVASALCFFLLPARWAVVGMAFSYGLAYVIGVGVAWRRLRVRLGGDLDGARVLRTYIRLAGASVPATVVSGAVAYGILQGLGNGTLGAVVAVLAGGIALAAVFVLAAKRMRVEELTAMVGAVRARLGR
ncbi:murein biosynthesis integral membrane protein MurJ [Streptomyces sp. HNM0574]|uniref:murein biosynthesis integral membrane protein MurJ n=1 Tax=Streptomyces sp. HNM0574 TaxID=2714954 RepID=UPI00146ECBFC|nr:murein biosynthesis integral membrane protein MurJ [Streptomyces sp. HNM0574]NLU69527.1 murein biosynthesis integral membrane protein MurJ [Streptomyces sp. HNM0574]